MTPLRVFATCGFSSEQRDEYGPKRYWHQNTVGLYVASYIHSRNRLEDSLRKKSIRSLRWDLCLVFIFLNFVEL